METGIESRVIQGRGRVRSRTAYAALARRGQAKAALRACFRAGAGAKSSPIIHYRLRFSARSDPEIIVRVIGLCLPSPGTPRLLSASASFRLRSRGPCPGNSLVSVCGARSLPRIPVRRTHGGAFIVRSDTRCVVQAEPVRGTYAWQSQSDYTDGMAGSDNCLACTTWQDGIDESYVLSILSVLYIPRLKESYVSSHTSETSMRGFYARVARQRPRPADANEGIPGAGPPGTKAKFRRSREQARSKGGVSRPAANRNGKILHYPARNSCP